MQLQNLEESNLGMIVNARQVPFFSLSGAWVKIYKENYTPLGRDPLKTGESRKRKKWTKTQIIIKLVKNVKTITTPPSPALIKG